MSTRNLYRLRVSDFWMVAAFSLMLMFANVLLIAKTSSVLQGMLKQTAITAVDPLVRQIREAYALGVYPESFLQRGQLNQLTKNNARLTHLEWLDLDGKVLAQSGDAPSDKQASLMQVILKAIKLRKPVDMEGETDSLVMPVLNSFDQAVGVLKINYQTQELEKLKKQLLDQSTILWMSVSLIGGLLLLGMSVIQRRGIPMPLPAYWRLTLLATISMLITAVSLFEEMDQAAKPVLTERVRSLAQAEQTLWNEALSQGFGHADFKDLPDRMNTLAAQHPELKEVRLEQTLHEGGADHSGFGVVALDEDSKLLFLPNPDFLQSLKLNLLLDYATLSVVMFFFFAQFKLAQGMDRAEALGENQAKRAEHRAEQVRPALFLYFLSEEFLRPFLPNYAAVLEPAYLTQLNGTWAGSLSISLFMLVVALSQPVLNRISTQSQAFTLMKWGCALTTLAQCMTGLAVNTETLLLGRALAGLGYSCAFVAAQSVLLMRYGPEKRTLAFASLVAAIMAATVVGPAFGGLLADNFGPGTAVAMAALTPLLAGLLFTRQSPKNTTNSPDTLSPDKPSRLAPVPKTSSGWLPGLGNRKLLSLSVFAAVPAKMMLTGLLFYLLPKTLTQLSESSASLSGRLILLYGLLMLIGAPWLAKRWQTKFQSQNNPGQLASKSVCWGLMTSALLGLVPLVMLATGWGAEHMANPQVWVGMTVVVAVTLGLGQASSISSQGALVQIYQNHFAPQLPPFAWLGTYRLIERMGNALGPLLVAWMLSRMNAPTILALFGLGAACCAGLVYLTLDARQTVQRAEP